MCNQICFVMGHVDILVIAHVTKATFTASKQFYLLLVRSLLLILNVSVLNPKDLFCGRLKMPFNKMKINKTFLSSVLINPSLHQIPSHAVGRKRFITIIFGHLVGRDTKMTAPGDVSD